jgi:hypothetical protein
VRQVALLGLRLLGSQVGGNVVPLDFLRRKGGGNPAAALPEPAPPAPVPEEAVAQEHQLRLTFGAKTSSGVRLQGGPGLLEALPMMLSDIAISEVEVVEPRATTLAVAAPSIIRTDEAIDWLRAHGGASPVTRHALYVLESLDAIDPAYDTFACALLDGEVDPAGYPEYASVVGGVAAHWDESTGDLIVRGVVGWGGRGTRGDTDRIATRLLHRILGEILESGESLGLTGAERPGAAPGGPSVTCQHCGYPAVHPRAVYCPKCGMRMLHS